MIFHNISPLLPRWSQLSFIIFHPHSQVVTIDFSWYFHSPGGHPGLLQPPRVRGPCWEGPCWSLLCGTIRKKIENYKSFIDKSIKAWSWRWQVGATLLLNGAILGCTLRGWLWYNMLHINTSWCSNKSFLILKNVSAGYDSGLWYHWYGQWPGPPPGLWILILMWDTVWCFFLVQNCWRRACVECLSNLRHFPPFLLSYIQYQPPPRYRLLGSKTDSRLA